ncbi:hypothetical protein GUITHDRAFT_78596 [Guillardia theta CCMP2712]|uniref:Tic20 family protein Ycf60 n=2 Tax=Guillardia theta TaxID=55529 RepID=L1ILE1_GUITC|nr:hypothetical protein GUITHDRAFT_78596 [Guillardia theta CCMP2712]EKX36937.1 hypothetical protein GUITHDRAFT_78596 [Guillardia theta CCMP2712]|eukprot:XP_005823917.1 hypothetical protein GUITHDRAFT_78596 [Guillardia theta CCMP2712]
MQYGSDDVPALDRFVACLPYALPLADSFEWGHFLFDKFPILALPFVPLFPVISLLNAPFVSFAVFIALFSFVTRNPSIPRFVRYNTLQAIYLDIALIFPSLFKGLAGNVPLELAETGSNTVFYAILLSVIYAAVSNISGKLPNEIPLISETVDGQMPF